VHIQKEEPLIDLPELLRLHETTTSDRAADEIESLRARVAELEASEASLSLVIKHQDRTLIRYREALEEVKAFVCGEAVSKWGIDPQTTKSRIRIANTCDVALLNLPKG
jgi:hypothetical protein